jgi:hypothetical protein
LLYFFQGRTAAVISHGIVKEDEVPGKEIERAVPRMKKFTANPARHTYAGSRDEKPKEDPDDNGRR